MLNFVDERVCFIQLSLHVRSLCWPVLSPTATTKVETMNRFFEFLI